MVGRGQTVKKIGKVMHARRRKNKSKKEGTTVANSGAKGRKGKDPETEG